MVTFNNIYNKVKKQGALLCVAAVASLATSCSDYLQIYPLDRVVLEDYWTRESEVEAVVRSCYESLESENSITRMAVWGELRSDNIISGGSLANYYVEALRENILPTSQLTDWLQFYVTINRCNTVINYAPGVKDADPNYTDDKLNANIAEATFIRDLCYFYLIRTFRDVPVDFEPSIDDTKDFQIAPTPMKEALKMLISDLDKVKDMAYIRYYDDTRLTNAEASRLAYENNSKVTRVAIYALLADMCLWAGEYDKAYDYCQYVIDFKKEQYKERKDAVGELTDMALFHDIPLILERPEGSLNYGNAHKEIFGDGNSFESIFELAFGINNTNIQNTFVGNFYGNASQSVGRFATPDSHYKDAVSGKNNYFDKDDCRCYTSIVSSNSRYGISKYCLSNVTLDISNITDEKSLKIRQTRRSQPLSNWIVYRLTDVMLMQAEACIYKSSPDFQEAFDLINAVNRRARHITSEGDAKSLKFEDYNSSVEDMQNLLLDERNRELMFEGKRWFDLVRVALRDGKTSTLIEKATTKYEDNVTAIKIKLADPNYIFWPYNREELKKNKNLKQNPAYSDTEDFVK